MKNPDVENWLDTSKSLLLMLQPEGSGLEVFGHGMPERDFADLVDREASRVDHALVALATATGEQECRGILSQLSRDTLIALFSRWSHYHGEWETMRDQREPQHWFPPRDTWRAVFLAMTGEDVHSTDAARTLWPEAF